MIDIDLTGMGKNLHKTRFDPSGRVPGFEIPVGEMRGALRDLYARIGGPRAKAKLFTDPLRPWRGVRYWLYALVAIPLGGYIGWLVGDVDTEPGWLVFGEWGLVFAIYFGLRGFVCFRPRAETLLALDGRPPVIYLRSFRDDGALVARPYRITLRIFGWGFWITEYTRGNLLRVWFQHGKVRLEQAIEDEASAIGPFIAIGQPNESHPDFGATRAYFEGDDVAWRTAVESWIERAALVVVVPGQTQGLGWELEKVQSEGRTPNLVLVFPPEKLKKRTARLEALAGMITDPRWREAITTPTDGELIAVFATARGDLVRVYASKPRLPELEFAVEVALYGIFCVPTAHA
jgi:hypothetical protein